MKCKYCGGHWELEYVNTGYVNIAVAEHPCCAMSELTDSGMTENEARKVILDDTRRFVMAHPNAYKRYYYDRPKAEDIPF